MYVPPAFKVDEPRAERFLAERGFGTLLVCDGARPVGAHVPFVFDAQRRLVELHVARANPIHDLVGQNPQVLLTCLGPDAYISPDWYVSHNQVPTWTYVAVHVAGRARLMKPEALRGHLDKLSATFEERLPKPPWTSAKMDPARLAALMGAIVGIVVEVEAIEGSWKLNQHKSAGDREGAIAGLRGRGEPAATAVAALMEEARVSRS